MLEEINSYRPALQKQHPEAAHVSWRAAIEGAVKVWTDGACEPNPNGHGGWGFTATLPNGQVVEACGGEPDTTNNRMEMLAIIEALERLPRDVPLVVCTDSQLCVLCATGRWKRKANLDLWLRMHELCDGRPVVFEWHKGHAGTVGNERADELAAMGRYQAMQAAAGWVMA